MISLTAWKTQPAASSNMDLYPKRETLTLSQYMLRATRYKPQKLIHYDVDPDGLIVLHDGQKLDKQWKAS